MQITFETARVKDSQGPGLAHRRVSWPRPETVHPVFSLQQQAGNQAVQHLLRKGLIQAKLSVSTPGDPQEQHADRVAEQVMRAHTGAPTAPLCTCPGGGQACAECQQKQHGTVARKSLSGGRGSAFHPALEHVLRSPGQPLDAQTRAFFEPRFGYDFKDVRIHTDEKAGESARAVDALAYTAGKEIVFASGRYKPETETGQHLIAHELAHVVQQSSGVHEAVQRQTDAGTQPQSTPDLRKIYSFGPTGAGRVETNSGTTVFPPKAPVDAKDRELVRAGTADQPILSRFGRYFTLDERQHPYAGPTPACNIRFVTEWTPDDGSPQAESEANSTANYYAPGEPLGTTLGSEYIFHNDRPGVLSLAYVFNTVGYDFLLLGHSVHFVNDPAAPPGATVLPK